MKATFIRRLCLVLVLCGGAMATSLRAGPMPFLCCSWSGIYPTVLTPFCKDGGVDVAALERQLQFELNGGVQGLLLLGTIGEGQYVSMEERAQTITTAVRVGGGRVPVVVGIHTCDFETARCQLVQARHLGASAALIKYIGNPHAPPSEVLGFYNALSDLHVLPIFYYHYPSNTKLKLSAEDIGQILCLPGVVGIKESTLNLREVEKHIRLVHGKGKVFLSGSALNLTQFLDIGGQGAMCAEAVLLPAPTVEAYHDYLHGCRDRARAIQSELFEMTPLLQSRATPAGVSRRMVMTAEDHKLPVPMGADEPQARLKCALNCVGVPTPTLVKYPLPPLTARDEKRVRDVMVNLQVIDWCVGAPIPPEPLNRCPTDANGGMILKTGSFQLGPNVGRDLLRSQGDGESGF